VTPPSPTLRPRAGKGSLRDLALLFALKAAAGAAVLAVGFTHVSDDDYTRIVIAERFAHAPKLDPSGTSWLPLPFWIYGAAMAAFGRSLAVARVVACVLGVVSVAPPYLALRGVGVPRAHALVGVAVAMALPWSIWTGVATVPEAPAAALVAAAAIAASRANQARFVSFAAASALGASLARYEAWPVCAVVAIAAARAKRWGAAAVAALGPAAWIAWNARAHGDPLHFLARVAAARQATGAGAAARPLVDTLLAYPGALVGSAPVLALVSAVALGALGSRDVRARWGTPLASAAAILAFLIYGDTRDGAPTHHPERALLGVWWILATFAGDALGGLARAAAKRVSPAWVVGACAAGLAACFGWSAMVWRHHPGRGEEDRAAQIARGLALRAREPRAVRVTPCDYEHYALIAAFGAPERAEIVAAPRAAVTVLCPKVEER
jgi:hypothetical protein